MTGEFIKFSALSDWAISTLQPCFFVINAICFSALPKTTRPRCSVASRIWLRKKLRFHRTPFSLIFFVRSTWNFPPRTNATPFLTPSYVSGDMSWANTTLCYLSSNGIWCHILFFYRRPSIFYAFFSCLISGSHPIATGCNAIICLLNIRISMQ